MSLDVFDIRATDQDVMQNAARELPAGFAETFDVATRSIAEWHGWGSYNNARERALSTYYDGVKARTGVQLPLYGMGGNVTLDELNEAIARLPQQPGDAEPSFPPLSEAAIDGMALQRMRRAHDDAEALAHRETSWGGTLGTIAGTLAAGLSDPANVATLPLGGAGSAPIALRALEFAVIAGGTEAVNALSGLRTREAAVPGSSSEIPGEIGAATLFGGALGAAFGTLSKLMGTGARTLPTSVRDEVNAATSELQLNVTNPFPTAAGEAAARDAVVDSVRAMLRGEPVKAGETFAARHVEDLAAASRATTPEDLAIAGERHLRPETYGEKPDVEAFARMPSAADDAASYWEARLAQASPEERAALGATDGDLPAVRAPDLAPVAIDRLAADPQTAEGVLRNLDRIRLEMPEADFTVAVRQADGSTQFVTRKLEDVMDEIDQFEKAGKELEACVIGLQAAE